MADLVGQSARQLASILFDEWSPGSAGWNLNSCSCSGHGSTQLAPDDSR